MFIVVDLETSHLSPFHGQILEIAALAIDGEAEVASFHSLVFASPEVLAVSGDALRINCLDPDELASAPKLEDVAADFRGWLSNLQGYTIHSFNNQFDRGFLAQDPWAIDRVLWGECIMDRAMRSMGLSRWPKLSAAAEHFKVSAEGDAHRAMPDARMAWLIYREILRARRETHSV
jgi:DNA polymerase III epsilon subunit-like protein